MQICRMWSRVFAEARGRVIAGKLGSIGSGSAVNHPLRSAGDHPLRFDWNISQAMLGGCLTAAGIARGWCLLTFLGPQIRPELIHIFFADSSWRDVQVATFRHDV